MSEHSYLIAENLELKTQVQNLKLEINQWQSHYDDLSMKYYQLQQSKINPNDLLEYEDLKIQQQRYQEQEIQQSFIIKQQNQFILNLQQENRDLIDKVDQLKQKAKNYDCLKQQYQNLEQASQKYFEELEMIKQRPPTIIVPNPDVTALYREINRLNAIIQQMCKNSIESICKTSYEYKNYQNDESIIENFNEQKKFYDQTIKKSDEKKQFY
ncbi:unnamed protein product [Paramecium pentaurelia]|uniref:Uncharacterized protein n=1 Tax=Paramecium pentaurelia TaxID=43138 RepID=A0A8S1WW34_9CILI|nr:unnamed protein product [Paramecium pentaurelia]